MSESLYSHEQDTLFQRTLIISQWLKTTPLSLTPQQTDDIIQAVLHGDFVLLTLDDAGNLRPIEPATQPVETLSLEERQQLLAEWHTLNPQEQAARTQQRRVFLRQMREKYAYLSTPRVEVGR